MDRNISELRREYRQRTLEEGHADGDALRQFKLWFDEAVAAGVDEPNAMHLSTVDTDGRPSGRIVLLKGLEEGGFVFYTNYLSRKGQQLDGTGFGALTFFWSELERQVRIEGKVTRVPEAVSDAYFGTRPRGSQLGAWVSPQSEEISGRHVLEEMEGELKGQFGDDPISRPPHWGGFVLVPDWIEFLAGPAQPPA